MRALLSRPLRSRHGPAALLVLGAAGAGLVALGRDGGPADGPGSPCLGASDDCEPAARADAAPSPASRRTVPAAEACRDAGYLCADLDASDGMVVRRWRSFEGTMVVHVPAPDFEAPAEARSLQRAAAAGIRVWNGHPFPILVDERGVRPAHVRVSWGRHLDGTQLGRASIRWGPGGGIEVLGLRLATRSPFRSRAVLPPDQVRLTAAHEMGHALGLGHSDSARDVMYQTNTATAPTARDFRTIEALYALADGTEIVP